MSYPITWIRAQYPALAHATVFLDNAAGAQVPQQVMAAFTETLTYRNANKGGAFRESREITVLKEAVRERVARFIGAASPDSVVFGPNSTTLCELLAAAWGAVLRPGDEVIVSELDHHANVDPWRRLASRGVVVKTWPTRGDEARLELADLEPLLSPRTRILAMTAASNALGTLTEVRGAGERVHAAGGLVMVDAVHYAPHHLPDVQELGADMLMFSPYKVFGPHLGVLYLSEAVLSRLPAPRLAFLPDGEPVAWEPGTQNHEAIAAFGAVFDYLNEAGREMGLGGEGRALWAKVFAAFAEHERGLAERMLGGLRELGAELYGLPGTEGRTATLSFNLPGRAPREVAEALAAENVAVASGHYYAYELMMHRLGLAERGGAVRASALHYTSEDDLERFLSALARLSPS
ncbi:MAG: cysteine desulfurase-like protein [Deinococcota bacterium]|nr:cysteine desulfurase-like protein [Deinococcota bacterium]